MPRERTLDERLRAVERSIDENATPEPGPCDRPSDSGSDAAGVPEMADRPARAASSEKTDRPETTDGGTPAGGETAGAQAEPRPRGVSDPAVRGPDGPAERNPDVDGDRIAERLSAVEAELAELQAGLQAVRGYVGNIEHVNESVERRANAAMAAVERLESEACPRSSPALANCSGCSPAGDPSGGNSPAGRDPRELVDSEEGPSERVEGTDSGAGTGLLDRLAALL